MVSKTRVKCYTNIEHARNISMIMNNKADYRKIDRANKKTKIDEIKLIIRDDIRVISINSFFALTLYQPTKSLTRSDSKELQLTK